MRVKGSICLAAALVLLFTQTGFAQEDASKYPSKPITYICPAPAGTGGDLSSRLMAKELEKVLGQPVMVVNKTGGSFTIGTAAIAAAKPDGYTIGYTGGPPVFYTPCSRSSPIIPPGTSGGSPVRRPEQRPGRKRGLPFKTFKELVAYARQNPKKVTYGTRGTTASPMS
jgi:tripartite-type tricarboxylate transporter receptor subunit TctC